MGFEKGVFNFSCDFCGNKEEVVIHEQKWIDMPEGWFEFRERPHHDKRRIVCSTDCRQTMVNAFKASELVAAAEFEARLAEGNLKAQLKRSQNLMPPIVYIFIITVMIIAMFQLRKDH